MLDFVCTVPGRPAELSGHRLGVREDLQRAVVAGPLADRLLEPLDRLDVVVEDVRRGLHDRAQRRVAEVVGDEDLDPGVRAQAAQLADGGREGASAAVGQVVAADAGDHDVLEAHDGDGLGHAARLVGVVPVGRPVLTAQKPQARVQVSPRIMTVAVRCSQHSPMFGQRASSQTVLSVWPRTRSLSSV